MPLTLFWILSFTGIILYLLDRRKCGKILIIIALSWLFLITTPFLPRLIVSGIENQFPQKIEAKHFAANDSVFILVLGGGHEENINLSPNDQLSYSSICRLVEGIRLHRLLPESHMVFSGITSVNKNSHAEVMKESAMSMGVEKKDISLLPFSVNTQQEANDFTRKFGTRKSLILVTDAIHMPRAMFLFRRAGQSPAPAPTNHLVKRDDIEEWGPSSSNIAMMEYAIHELAGMALAKTGWGSEDSSIKK